MDYKKEIVKEILGISGRYSVDIIFRDWVECCALSIQNSCSLFHDDVWSKREQQYLKVI